MLAFVLLSAFLWGLAIACFAQFTELGKYVCVRLSWFAAVVAGTVDMLLLLLVTHSSLVSWWHVGAVLFATSVPIVFRGVWHEYDYNKRQIQNAKDAAGEQDTVGITGHDIGL